MKNGPGEIAHRSETGREHIIERLRDALNDGFLANRRDGRPVTLAEAGSEFGQDFAHHLGHQDSAMPIDHRPDRGDPDQPIDRG